MDAELTRLMDIVKKLRSESGCPWDRDQTHESLKLPLIEECYEVISAIDNNDNDNLKEELGDLLMLIFFHTAIAEENETFSIKDVCNGICDKLILRHPHVFSDLSVESAQDVIENWEAIKRKEKGVSTYTQELKAIPNSLPSLLRAAKVQKKALRANLYKPEDIEQVILKLKKEVADFSDHFNQVNYDIFNKIGGLLFLLTEISMFFNINPEFSLTNATEQFINRFEYTENTASLAEKEL